MLECEYAQIEEAEQRVVRMGNVNRQNYYSAPMRNTLLYVSKHRHSPAFVESVVLLYTYNDSGGEAALVGNLEAGQLRQNLLTSLRRFQFGKYTW